jgi:hypothetical protein
VAHAVLLVLASYANKDGSARPSSSTVADGARLTDAATRDALTRLQGAGLVALSGQLNGNPVWRLNLAARRDDAEASESDRRRTQANAKAAERAQRHRKHVAGDHTMCGPRCKAGNGVADRDVTVSDTVTVTPSHTVRHAVSHRESRCPTPFVTPSTPLQPQVSTPITASELPIELPKRTANTLSAAPRDDDAFTRFWAAYPKRVKRKDATRAFAKAVSNGHPAELLTAEARRWAELWAAEQREQKYIPDPTTWLNGERWTDAPPAPRPAGGHRPSTTDQRIADAQALKQRFAGQQPARLRLAAGGAE